MSQTLPPIHSLNFPGLRSDNLINLPLAPGKIRYNQIVYACTNSISECSTFFMQTLEKVFLIRDSQGKIVLFPQTHSLPYIPKKIVYNNREYIPSTPFKVNKSHIKLNVEGTNIRLEIVKQQ